MLEKSKGVNNNNPTWTSQNQTSCPYKFIVVSVLACPSCLLKICTIIYLLLFVPLSSTGQTGNIKGRIYDFETNEGLAGASIEIQVKNEEQDMKSYFGCSGTNGNFNIYLPSDNGYTMQIFFLGYEPKTINTEAKTNADLNIGLKRSVYSIDEIRIVEKKQRVVVKKDTVEYSAEDYKVNQDATVGDLLSKLPGLIVENDQITAYGEEVTKILVDGEEFFTGDPGIALNNLPAGIVDKVEVIDKKSDQAEFTGFDDGNTQKTINIKTKNGKLNGQFGEFLAGTDLVELYTLNGNINAFNGKRRFSIVGSSNNINSQNFFNRDNMGMGAGNSPGGLKTTSSVGGNINDKWGDKVKINGNYFMNKISGLNENTLFKEYYITDTTLRYSADTNNSTENNRNQRMNLRVEYTLDKNNSFIITPSVMLQDFSNVTNKSGYNYSENNSLLNQTENVSTNNNHGNELGNSILYRHKFGKKGRTISMDVSGKTQHTDNEQLTVSNTNYLTPNSIIVNQSRNTRTSTKQVSSSLRYTEPIWAKGLLLLSLENSNDKVFSDIHTNSFDSLTNGYLLDTLLSTENRTTTKSWQGTAGYRINYANKLFISATLGYKTTFLHGEQDIRFEKITDHNFENIEPRIEFNYSSGKKTNIKLTYDGKAKMPGISNLYEIVDIGDPMNIEKGNSALVPEYLHAVRTNIRLVNTAKASFVTINFDGRFSDNYLSQYAIVATEDTLISENIVLQRGASFNMPVNISGYSDFSGLVMYSFPFDKIKCNVSYSLGAKYSHSPAILNETKYFSNNCQLKSFLKLTSNISEKVDFSISYNAEYSLLNTTVKTNTNSNYYKGDLGCNLYLVPLYKVVFTSDMNLVHYSGIDAGYTNKILWNAGFAYKILKHNRGEIKLSMHDILNSNSSISRNLTSFYVEDKNSLVLTRYIMLSFNYKLRNINS